MAQFSHRAHFGQMLAQRCANFGPAQPRCYPNSDFFEIDFEKLLSSSATIGQTWPEPIPRPKLGISWNMGQFAKPCCPDSSKSGHLAQTNRKRGTMGSASNRRFPGLAPVISHTIRCFLCRALPRLAQNSPSLWTEDGRSTSVQAVRELPWCCGPLVGNSPGGVTEGGDHSKHLLRLITLHRTGLWTDAAHIIQTCAKHYLFNICCLNFIHAMPANFVPTFAKFDSPWTFCCRAWPPKLD